MGRAHGQAQGYGTGTSVGDRGRGRVGTGLGTGARAEIVDTGKGIGSGDRVVEGVTGQWQDRGRGKRHGQEPGTGAAVGDRVRGHGWGHG